MEKQIQKQVEHDMETGVTWRITQHLFFLGQVGQVGLSFYIKCIYTHIHIYIIIYTHPLLEMK